MNMTPMPMYIAVALFSVAATAGPTKIDCPKEIHGTESVVIADNSWSVTRDEGGRQLLRSVLVYWGHPRKMGNLIGEEPIKRHQKEISTWNLDSSGNEEHWVACSYTNSSALLTKALPRSYKKCELTTELIQAGTKSTIVSFVCE